MKLGIPHDFLLSGAAAKMLYAALMETPIFDFHCHVPAKEIYENRKYQDIGALWLKDDHYKWRAMRACGLREERITGAGSSNLDKFRAWAGVLPKCAGSVLLSWSQLELTRCFGVEEMPDEENADRLWNELNGLLHKEEFRPRALLARAGVALLCTTDDPADPLDYHQKLSEDTDFSLRVMPTWRPDRFLHIEKQDFSAAVADLETAGGVKIESFAALKKALFDRMEHFERLGCRSSDHSLQTMPFRPAPDAGLEEIFEKRMLGHVPGREDEEAYKTALLTFLAREYRRRGWVMQLHLGAMRDNNRRMLEKLGANSGFDSMDDSRLAAPLSGFLDRLDYTNELPKTVLYPLNPKDCYTIGTMMGNYQTDEVPGKLQLGAAWWFNDHIDGIRQHITDLANLSVLASHIGMVTDARCVLSYFSRHELFRRVLCSVLGGWAETGRYPYDTQRLIKIVQDIAFHNAGAYFGCQE